MQRTPLHSFHADKKAKMVDFAGWEMPMFYTSIIDEHNQVRKSGGMFDVSHMGRVKVTGRRVSVRSGQSGRATRALRRRVTSG